MSPSIRRIVTGHDQKGRAIVLSDGPAPFVHVNKAERDWYSVDIWRTHEIPAKIVPQAPEPTEGPRRQMPTTNGTVLRINSFPPESEAVRNMTPADSLRVFEGLGNPKAATHGRGGRHLRRGSRNWHPVQRAPRDFPSVSPVQREARAHSRRHRARIEHRRAPRPRPSREHRRREHARARKHFYHHHPDRSLSGFFFIFIRAQRKRTKVKKMTKIPHLP